jgi:hypothetical protein
VVPPNNKSAVILYWMLNFIGAVLLNFGVD